MAAHLVDISRIRAMLFIGVIASMMPAAWCQKTAITGQSTDQQSVVVFAARKIPKGSVLKGEYLQESVINSRGFDKHDIPSRSAILGSSPKYAIKAGQIIFGHDLVPRHMSHGNSSAQNVKGVAAKFIQAKNAIPAGAIIKRDDLVSGSITACDSSRWLHDIDPILGLHAKIPIVAGQILTEDALVTATSHRKSKGEDSDRKDVK